MFSFYLFVCVCVRFNDSESNYVIITDRRNCGSSYDNTTRGNTSGLSRVSPLSSSRRVVHIPNILIR